MLRQIKNFPLYAISSKDNLVLNIKTGKAIKPFKDSCGYLMVNLYNNDKKKTCLIHRLVATHFIDNPENKPCVNHIDGNKENNDIPNLEWATHSENMVHAYNTGLKKPNKGIYNNHRSKPVIAISPCGYVRRYFPSTREAGRQGFDQSCVTKCCKGKQKLHKGYVWKYV